MHMRGAVHSALLLHALTAHRFSLHSSSTLHCEFCEHSSAHLPSLHTKGASQPEVAVHGMRTHLPPSHFSPSLHSESAEHPNAAAHTPLLHLGVEPPQWLLVTHCTHLFDWQ
jgi:hypothetical protein